MPFIEYVDAPAHSSSSGISGALMRRRIEYIDWRPPGDQSRRAGMLFPESIAERESISCGHGNASLPAGSFCGYVCGSASISLRRPEGKLLEFRCDSPALLVGQSGETRFWTYCWMLTSPPNAILSIGIEGHCVPSCRTTGVVPNSSQSHWFEVTVFRRSSLIRFPLRLEYL